MHQLAAKCIYIYNFIHHYNNTKSITVCATLECAEFVYIFTKSYR